MAMTVQSWKSFSVTWTAEEMNRHYLTVKLMFTTESHKIVIAVNLLEYVVEVRKRFITFPVIMPDAVHSGVPRWRCEIDGW